MSVTITGIDYQDVIRQLGKYPESAPIQISFIKDDFTNMHEKGCIVKVRHEHVPLKFIGNEDAAAYILKILTEHDRFVDEKNKT